MLWGVNGGIDCDSIVSHDESIIADKASNEKEKRSDDDTDELSAPKTEDEKCLEISTENSQKDNDSDGTNTTGLSDTDEILLAGDLDEESYNHNGRSKRNKPSIKTHKFTKICQHEWFSLVFL